MHTMLAQDIEQLIDGVIIAPVIEGQKYRLRCCRLDKACLIGQCQLFL